MRRIFADLHVHIGRTEQGQPVKISGSKNLTFYNIAKEASERKGIELIGVIDCQSPAVQQEIADYLRRGEMEEIPGGGIRYGQTTILLGSEIEVRDEGMGPAHLLAFLPGLDAMRSFTEWLKSVMKNVNLSSQRIYAPARKLQHEVIARGGLMIPAHIFTPHRSLFGSCTDSLEKLLDPDRIAAVELGLSADTQMAGMLSELDRYPFVTNSDAHSLSKIGREYNALYMEMPSFEELRLALSGEAGRRVTANYGLKPQLGKYHRTYCLKCGTLLSGEEHQARCCPQCGSEKIVRGVMDRIIDIADQKAPPDPALRPPYHYQVPLEFIPGVGKRTLEAMLNHFGTEMNILHQVKISDLAAVAGEKAAGFIRDARNGRIALSTGGGGRYGKVRDTR